MVIAKHCVCSVLRCLLLYESKVGVMREDLVWKDDGNGVCGESGYRKEGCNYIGCRKGDCGRCCRWKVWKKMV